MFAILRCNRITNSRSRNSSGNISSNCHRAEAIPQSSSEIDSRRYVVSSESKLSHRHRSTPVLLRRLSTLSLGRYRSGTESTAIFTSCPSTTIENVHEESQSTSMTDVSSQSQSPTVMSFLQEDCPREVLPLVIAFAGPQIAQRFSSLNRFWNSVLNDNATWKVLCQELYKETKTDIAATAVNGSRDMNWKRLYHLSPCIPIDYHTLEHALQAVAHPIQVWLRPGHTCILTQPLIVTHNLTIRVMVLPVTTSSSMPTHTPTCTPCTPPTTPLRSSTKSKRKQPECQPSTTRQVAGSETAAAAFDRTLVSAAQSAPLPVATLILFTCRSNTPVIWVQSGTLQLHGVVLHHACLGVDIWNGNAALQVQPRTTTTTPTPLRDAGGGMTRLRGRRWRNLHHPDADNIPPFEASWTSINQDHSPDIAPFSRPLPPRAHLINCQVTSQSGRGIVVMDGGYVSVEHTRIVDCAATGLYIGGTEEVAAAVVGPNRITPLRSRVCVRNSTVSGNGVGSYYSLPLILASSSFGSSSSSSSTSTSAAAAVSTLLPSNTRIPLSATISPTGGSTIITIPTVTRRPRSLDFALFRRHETQRQPTRPQPQLQPHLLSQLQHRSILYHPQFPHRRAMLINNAHAVSLATSSTIARGHSGVYLEQGECTVTSSVIRDNALMGISALSESARLMVTQSIVDGNGTNNDAAQQHQQQQQRRLGQLLLQRDTLMGIGLEPRFRELADLTLPT